MGGGGLVVVAVGDRKIVLAAKLSHGRTGMQAHFRVS